MSDALDLMRAINLANKYFYGKIEPKDGMPQVMHSLRVMLAGTTTDEQVVGMLHDILEDTRATEQTLLDERFERVIIDAVLALTHHAHEPYDAYIHRLAGNTLAHAVKIHDLKDNIVRPAPTNESPEISEKRKKKYAFWLEYLTA